ncbi:MAG: DUF4299 domain-containing protein [Tannerellaceae bacterium]|nr:DUF4299 domain-containing protein [Tannerellaceae bacterium]
MDEMEEGIIPWNMKVLKNYLESNKDSTFIILGAANPISMEAEVREKLLQMAPEDAEKAYADYINEKQQMDVYHMYPSFYNSSDGIFGAYALTEGVDSVIPAKPYIPFNSGLSKDIKNEGIQKWIVSLVVNTGKDYDLAGYIKYEDLINNLPQEKLTRYDESHYVLKGLNRNEIDRLLLNRITL